MFRLLLDLDGVALVAVVVAMVTAGIVLVAEAIARACGSMDWSCLEWFFMAAETTDVER